MCSNKAFVAQHLFNEAGGLGYTELHCGPFLMQEASKAAFSGHPFCYLGVHTVIDVST